MTFNFDNGTSSSKAILNFSGDTQLRNQHGIVSGEPESVWTPEVIIRVAVVLSVMIFTVIGNVFLIIMLTCKQSRRIKRVNIFIINLAIGDLAVAFITMTTEVIFVAFGEWVLGPVLCKLTVYLQVVTLSSATFLLVGMSIDRYQVIVKPMESLASRPKIWTKVIIAWLLAMIFALPQVFIFLQETTTKNGKVRTLCRSNGYTAKWQRKMYFSFFALYVLLIPAAVMLFCYYNIAKVVWRRIDSQQGRQIRDDLKVSSPRVSVRRNLVSASKQRVVKMTLLVIIGFLVCLTPYIGISVIRIYSDYKIELSKALAVSEIIFMLHSAINPVLYGIFTLRIYHIKRVFSCVNRRQELREDIIKHRHLDQSRYVGIRERISFLFQRRRHKNAGVIIANHAAKEESELIVRSVRKTNSIKRAVVARTLSNSSRRTRSEKGTQVDDMILLNTLVCNKKSELCFVNGVNV